MICTVIVLLECFVKLYSQTFVMDFHKANEVLLIFTVKLSC